MLSKPSKGKSKFVRTITKSNMFRWLKDRKKQKRPGSRKKSDEDYGFQSNSSGDNSDYGFNDRLHGQFHPGFKDLKPLDDAAYHIYEEILDLPCSPESEYQSSRSHSDRSHSSHPRVQRIEEEGPYMVVPIIIHDASERSDDKCILCGEIGAIYPFCKCQSSRSTSEGNYSPPWDSSDEISIISRLSDTNHKPCDEFSKFQDYIIKNRQHESGDAYVSSDKSDSSRSSRSSYGSRSVQSSRSNSEMDYNDTCCEYDMSTSGDSDISDAGAYRSSLEKVQRNLLLKHQVRSIIKTLSTGGNDISEGSSTITSDRSDVESMASGRSSAPIFDPEVFFEKSESDDSSGYYECSEDVPQTVPCNENLKPKRHHTKHRSQNRKLKDKHISVVRSQSCGAIQEDTEMYLLPTTKRDSVYNATKLQKIPLFPPKSTVIYQDPNRNKTGNNNRLLGDLIRMNYEKQHMIRV